MHQSWILLKEKSNPPPSSGDLFPERWGRVLSRWSRWGEEWMCFLWEAIRSSFKEHKSEVTKTKGAQVQNNPPTPSNMTTETQKTHNGRGKNRKIYGDLKNTSASSPMYIFIPKTSKNGEEYGPFPSQLNRKAHRVYQKRHTSALDELTHPFLNPQSNSATSSPTSQPYAQTLT